MKNYTITVNGNVYDVSVEETGTAASAPRAATATPARTAPAATTAPAKPASAPAAKSAGAGSVKITAGAAGKVFKIEKSVGAAVKKGDAVIILESMKMEIPMVAPQDGTVASVDVSVGDPCEAGDLLATMN